MSDWIDLQQRAITKERRVGYEDLTRFANGDRGNSVDMLCHRIGILHSGFGYGIKPSVVGIRIVGNEQSLVQRVIGHAANKKIGQIRVASHGKTPAKTAIWKNCAHC